MAKLTQSLFLLAAVRTPIGKFGGGLSSLTAAELGTSSARATLETHDEKLGLATVCISGGMGLSMIVERV